MASNIRNGDMVYVPCSLFSELSKYPKAVYRTEVVGIENKSIRIKLPNETISNKFSISLAHKTLGLMIVSVGDYDTELTLLDPLSKSILQYARLLMDDDYIRRIKIRTLEELKRYWQRENPVYSHVIIIGHGCKTGIKFGDQWVNADEFQKQVLRIWGGDKKTIISLCCKTGYKTFGGKISSFAQCRHFIGPFHSVHGAVASQFCQTFLAYHLLEGKTTKVAFNKARMYVPGSTSFRLWGNNQLKAGPKT